MLRMIRQFTFHHPKQIIAPTLWLFLSQAFSILPAILAYMAIYLLGQAFYPPYTLDIALLIKIAIIGITYVLLQYAVELISYYNMGVIGRKAMVPLSFAICLAKEPTGSLLASLQAMRLPKAVGIGLAVLLRFFPTIGGEYRAIRASQRFREIGVGVVHTLTHLPSTVEYILIPLILRTTKVAEELSASMTVRGVRFSGETISYRPVRFTGKDAALCAMAVLIPAAVFLLERRGVF